MIHASCLASVVLRPVAIPSRPTVIPRLDLPQLAGLSGRLPPRLVIRVSCLASVVLHPEVILSRPIVIPQFNLPRLVELSSRLTPRLVIRVSCLALVVPLPRVVSPLGLLNLLRDLCPRLVSLCPPIVSHLFQGICSFREVVSLC